MKATINKEGYLTVIPENELEIYALSKWSEENMSNKTPNKLLIVAGMLAIEKKID